MDTWRADQASKVQAVLSKAGFSVHERTDDDGDVWFIVSWPESGPLHCRAHFGFDDDGAHYSFYSFGWQGVGGPGTPIMKGDAAETAASHFAYGCLDFRRMADAIKNKAA